MPATFEYEDDLRKVEITTDPILKLIDRNFTDLVIRVDDLDDLDPISRIEVKPNGPNFEYIVELKSGSETTYILGVSDSDVTISYTSNGTVWTLNAFLLNLNLMKSIISLIRNENLSLLQVEYF